MSTATPIPPIPSAVPGVTPDEGPGVVTAAPFDGSIPVARDRSRLSNYITLCKPRLNFMVLVSTAVGFYVAAPFNALALLHVLIGTALTAAASAVLNQWMERDRDLLMPRTRNRPLPAGRVAPVEALILGLVLSALGLGYLAWFCNLLTFALGAMTLVTYLGIYTPLKTVSTLNTVIGAIPGALPPVMGFAAATGDIGHGAMSLFAILFLWQMPHFLAIATLYREDYRAGGYVMLPVVDESLRSTSRQSLIYLSALLLVSLTPTLFGLTGVFYAAAALFLGIGFFLAGAQQAISRTRKDARMLFFVSIIYLPLLLTAMVIDKL
jgi:heme o synthase